MEIWGVAGLLEIGDHSAFETSLRHYKELSKQYHLSNFAWGLRCAQAMRAILHGKFAEAERLANDAFEIGGDTFGELASGVYGVQMFTIRREQGRLAEGAPLFRRFLDENPRDAAWRPGLAGVANDLGFEAAARTALAETAAHGFAFPIDVKRSLSFSDLAEGCTRR